MGYEFEPFRPIEDVRDTTKGAQGWFERIWKRKDATGQVTHLDQFVTFTDAGARWWTRVKRAFRTLR